MFKHRVIKDLFIVLRSMRIRMIIVFNNFSINTFTRNNRILRISTGINPSKTYLTLSIKLNHDPIIFNN